MINFDDFEFVYGYGQLNTEEKSNCLDSLLALISDLQSSVFSPGHLVFLFKKDFDGFHNTVHKLKSTLSTLCSEELEKLSERLNSLSPDSPEEDVEALHLSTLKELSIIKSDIEDLKIMVS